MERMDQGEERVMFEIIKTRALVIRASEGVFLTDHECEEAGKDAEVYVEGLKK